MKKQAMSGTSNLGSQATCVLAMLLLAACLFGASKLLGQKMGQLFKA